MVPNCHPLYAGPGKYGPVTVYRRPALTHKVCAGKGSGLRVASHNPWVLTHFSLNVFLALLIQSRMSQTLPDRNTHLPSRDPNIDLLLLLPTGGEAHIPPQDTAPTAMIVALIAEPAGDVTLMSRRASHCATDATPMRSGKKRRKVIGSSLWWNVWFNEL